jgi:type I restriction-modification system DNA methylase subunit
MSNNEQQTLPVKPLNNGLFADYYLENIVPKQPEWDEALFASGKAALTELQTLRAGLNPAALDEVQLEEHWIKPVLHILGHHYAVQGKIRYRDSGHRKPDYFLLASKAEADAITSEVYASSQLTHVVAVADAKRWGSKLDQASPKERNPSQQIDEYLRYSERPWGILTDGRYWRLYHRDTSKYNTYYAVDLDALLDAGDTNSFLYFYAFFRLEAFTSGWLTKVLAGSEDFAQKLTDKLEDEVYDALELIAQGFLDYRRNNLNPDPATLREIYQQSLVLLYRLLFIFYAESREILPMDNDGYKTQLSMTSIKNEVMNTLNSGRSLDADSGRIYNRLRDLFFAIDAGSPRSSVPPYNGRLFSDKEHPFLADKIVGDEQLIPALDKLARVDDDDSRKRPDDNNKRVFVDYRDLEVRHLGSIYEKLLEYELDIATEPLTVRGGQYATAKANEKVEKQPGEVYLRTGSNERKVTGSYYTPDYIVRFIVEKTLEPLLSAIRERYATQDEEGVWHVAEDKRAALISDVLALNVLDPATGSGHFVVDVTSYIAEWLRALSLRPTDIGEEDELIYWKRQVASACIYAVDINPLAVELAKLSMWLTTLAKGKPLSFLDHHIRVGNSLVGTRISEIDDLMVSVDAEKKARAARAKRIKREATTGQINMFSDADFSEGVRFAVQQMSAIENTIADSVQDVKQQEQLYASLTKRLSAWKQAADVWTARYFGLALTFDQWKAVRDFTTSGLIPPKYQHIVDAAGATAAEQRFFHWDLAFPEIFFDASGQPKDNPGFDAVVGNPPYVRWQSFKLDLKKYFEASYDVYNSSADLFLYFYELGLRHLKPEHRLGYITSGTYMNSNSAKPFRQYIHQNAAMEWVANFGENQPFRGAEMVYPTIAVMRSGKSRETFRNLFIEGTVHYSRLGKTVTQDDWEDSLSEATGLDEWRFQAKELTLLFKKLNQHSIKLDEFIKGEIYYGVLTGLNEAFVIDSTTRRQLVQEHQSSEELIAPILRGQDLRPWYQINNDQHLILARQGINIDDYPAIKRHLEKFREALEVRPSEWDTARDGKWKGRTAGDYRWFEWHDVVAYHQKFREPKIMWADIAKIPRFSRNEGSYVNNTGFFIANPKMSLLALLQSRSLWFALSQISTPLRLRGGLWQYRAIIQFVKRLPIPELTADQESALGALAEGITQLAQTRYQRHESMRQTIRNEFGGGEIGTQVRLYRWWELEDEKALSDEIRRQLGQDIPLGRRSEWRKFLADEQAKHQGLTAQIIKQETRMNAIVYDAFDLTPEERDLIERTTKYPYGEV